MNTLTFGCRKCGYTTLDRSRVRWHERWRKLVSTKRPYRCAACGERVWMHPVSPASRDLPPDEPGSLSLEF